MPRPSTTLALVLLAISLSACATSTPLRIEVEPVQELRTVAAKPPAALTRRCPQGGPPLKADLPNGQVSSGQVERKIAALNIAIEVCEKQNVQLEAFYRSRDAGLAGITGSKP